MGFKRMHETFIEQSQIEMTQVHHDLNGEAVSETVFLRDGSRFTIPLKRRPTA